MILQLHILFIIQLNQTRQYHKKINYKLITENYSFETFNSAQTRFSSFKLWQIEWLGLYIVLFDIQLRTIKHKTFNVYILAMFGFYVAATHYKQSNTNFKLLMITFQIHNVWFCRL